MKNFAVFAIAVSLSGLFASGEEPQTNKLDAGINIIKSPVATKGLYGKQSESAQHNDTDPAVMRALRYLQKTQNQDGSWGGTTDRDLATPLVLLSFLGRGETPNSKEFSNTITTAHTWLLNATPADEASRLATIVAISAYCDLCYASSQAEQKTAEITKLQTVLDQVSPTNGGLWIDLAAFSHIPENLPKHAWGKSQKETQAKYMNTATNLSPLTVEEYLTTYLTACAMFHQGGERWHEFNRRVTPELMKRQESDGSFPISNGQSRFIVTALATLRLELRSQYEPHISARPQPKERKTNDKEIRVDVK